jgi:hypothetical protein
VTVPVVFHATATAATPLLPQLPVTVKIGGLDAYVMFAGSAPVTSRACCR